MALAGVGVERGSRNAEVRRKREEAGAEQPVTFRLPDYPTTRLSDYSTIRLPDYPTTRLSDYQTIRLPDHPTTIHFLLKEAVILPHGFKLTSALFAAAFCLMMFYPSKSVGQKTTSEDVIPEVVVSALNAKFPGAEIEKWTKEKEGEMEIYDIEFRQRGQKMEADFKADGSVHNWEKAIGVDDLPEAVVQAVQRKYPKSGMKEIMLITAVADGKEELEGYEIVLETAGGKEVEVTVAEDGRILEDSGEGK